MPRINQLQMQISTAFSPNFTIKGWVHAKHLAQHYSREWQLPSANLLLVIDKYLDPQLFLMETIWPVPEEGQSMEGEQHIPFSPPFPASFLKSLFRSENQCRDGCWGKESRLGAARQSPLLSLQGQRQDQHHQPRWGEPAPHPC